MTNAEWCIRYASLSGQLATVNRTIEQLERSRKQLTKQLTAHAAEGNLVKRTNPD